MGDRSTIATHDRLQREPARVQAKLTVSSRGDRLEQEADAIADRVLRSTGEPVVGEYRNAGIVASAGGGVTVPALRAERVPVRGGGMTSEQDRDEREPGEAEPISLAGGGAPLEPSLRSYFEPRLAADLSGVHIRTDGQADRAARALRARAFTVGSTVTFADGEYQPASVEGRRLLAHELVHVLQQGAAASAVVSRKESAGRADASGHNEDELEELEPVTIGGSPDVQREDAPAPPVETAPQPADAPPASPPSPPTPPATATPTLTLTPAATLVRGSRLTATVAFTPVSGETINITEWRYTAADGDVTRPAGESTFQTSWAGTMAQTGNIELDFEITPSGGTAGATETITQAVTVTDRTGASWVTGITNNREAALTGKPSPPVVFSDLGLHTVPDNELTVNSSPITSGPNLDFTIVTSVTGRNFKSNPTIHPDVTNLRSAFGRFHSDPSRLYFTPSTGKELIPIADYSGLSLASGVTFTVPDWEAFYKRHRFYVVEATAPSAAAAVPALDAWWGLDSNAEDAAVVIRDAAAIRTALGISATDPFTITPTVRDGGGWDGYILMQAPAIRTGTQSHEYVHAEHSHRANFHKMMRALDPRRILEKTVSTPTNTVDYGVKVTDIVTEIMSPDHEIVDEAASRAAEAFVAVGGVEMAGVNEDPATGDSLGTVWNITGDDVMTN